MGGSSRNSAAYWVLSCCVLALLAAGCAEVPETGRAQAASNIQVLDGALPEADSAELARAELLYDSAAARIRLDALDTLATIAMLLEAADVYVRAAPPRWVSVLNCYGGIASQAHRSQYSDTALYYAEAGDRLMRDHPEAFKEFSASVTLRYFALAFSDAHRFDLARQYAMRALDHANRTGDQVQVGRAMDVLADVCSRTGDNESALGLERDQIALLMVQLDTARIGHNSILYRLGDAHLTMSESFKEMHEVDSSYFHQLRALWYAKQYAPGGRDVATFEVNLGIAQLLFWGNLDSTIHYIERAQEHMPKGDGPGKAVLTQGLSWLAIAYAVKGDTVQARGLARRELDENFRYFNDQPNIDWGRTDVQVMQMMDGYACTYEELFKVTQDPADAAVACRINDDVIRGHQLTYIDADPAALIGASANRTAHMNRYISFLHACKGSDVPAEKLVALFETKRSDQLRAQLQGVEELGLGSQQLRTFRELTAQRGLLVAEGHGGGSVGRIARLDLSIDSLRNLLSSFSSSSPNVDGGKLLERVRAAIDDSTLVLNFSWADDANGAFLQTLAVTKVRHGFRVQPLQPEIDSLLKSKVLGLRVGAPDTDDGTLWRRLLPVGMDLSTFRSVVVLPDGPLNALPFESLVVSGADGMKELLMDHCEVRYEYCLTFLADTTAALPSGDVLACAPDFSTPDTSWASLDDEGTIKQAAPSFLRAGPGPLTQNVAEVEELLQWMPGSSIVGTDINEADLREELTGRAVLHFATHAICSARMPELSGILLSHSNGSANGERAVVVGDGAACMDGVLHAYEIQSMDLPVDLVVLSACETSLGKERLGEGAMSIARAFKYAGAKSIISSLWKVDDRATKEIMVKFYEKLAEGTGKADALAEAKRWYRKENPNAPPSHWAAFILIGDNEPVHLKKRSPVRPWMFGGGALVALAAALARRRHRRSQRAA